ncbi:hypothetical protein ACN38_g9892 [Penicillium nordicum]|uniref:Uncharacterized protein n=1 Tax=Penicillium nordicum TaxID=229535 RepID=A0A0M9WC53_9EURO|nr:hypothetical protein ACN38_g9892 [Penicillium nordicum]
MVRLVFRPYTQIRRSICTPEPLQASTRAITGYRLSAYHKNIGYSDDNQCVCGAQVIVTHVLVDRPRPVKSRRKPRTEVGDSFNTSRPAISFPTPAIYSHITVPDDFILPTTTSSIYVIIFSSLFAASTPGNNQLVVDCRLYPFKFQYFLTARVEMIFRPVPSRLVGGECLFSGQTNPW